ncbi:MAG TPA: cysteine desulfurase [Nitrososphaeraceae archaeon]|jgi:cysteine desulfurase/selenocysteine lyase|nr:cysteine desulfurase [Nitrososphaeraceae archaeon]
MMQSTALDIEKIRKDFPILERRIKGGHRLIYLDNAATTQKPKVVIDAITNYYTSYNSNIHRAVHQLAEEATSAYEEVRQKVAKLINAQSVEEIVFTKNATESINLVANSWAKQKLTKGDKVLTSEIEHHSNIVPWQLIAGEVGASVSYLNVRDDGLIDLDGYPSHLSDPSLKLVSISQMSNVLGSILPVRDMIKLAHERNIPVMIDAAQSVPHMKVDVQDLDCDFMAFSAHKMLGPTGVGILFAKRELLEEMPPFIGGGDMIKEVHKDHTIFNDLPYKFEAGTPNIADVIGFGAAIDYLNDLGFKNIREHEIEITRYALERMSEVSNITIYGPKDTTERGAVISFNLGDIHPHDLATILNDFGIAMRSGHHCAQVLMERLEVSATSRVSFYLYNSKEEVNILINALENARRLFGL